MNSLAVIPTCGESPDTLLRLVKTLRDDRVETMVIINNMAEDAANSLEASLAALGVFAHHWDKPFNIYAMWNAGIFTARVDKRRTLFILNDDIEIAPGSAEIVDQVLNSHPNIGAVGWDYTIQSATAGYTTLAFVSGSYRKGGIGGFAFAVKPDSPYVDEEFTWWGGDDDLFNKIERRMGRRLAIARGLGVKHHTSSSANARPEVYADVERDRSHMLETWGESW